MYSAVVWVLVKDHGDSYQGYLCYKSVKFRGNDHSPGVALGTWPRHVDNRF